MPRTGIRALAIASFLLLAFGQGCGEMKKGFDQGFCTSFEENFNKSCTDACVAGGKKTREDCTASCKTELPKQEKYASRCAK